MQFHTTFTENTAQLARKLKNGTTVRLLLILPEYLSYTEFRRLNQEAIGRELGANNSTISRAMAELLAEGVVERKGKGPYTEWRLSSDYGWRGNVDSFHEHRRKQGKLAPMKNSATALIAAEGILWKFGCGEMRAGLVGLKCNGLVCAASGRRAAPGNDHDADSQQPHASPAPRRCAGGALAGPFQPRGA